MHMHHSKLNSKSSVQKSISHVLPLETKKLILEIYDINFDVH